MPWVRRAAARLPGTARRDEAIAERDATIVRLRRRVRRLRAKRDRLRARRDALRVTVAELRTEALGQRRRADALATELAAAENAFRQPSQQTLLASAIREWRYLESIGRHEDGFDFGDKLSSYSFARSHSVPTPRLYRRWEHLADLTPETLETLLAAPRPRMLKSARGHSSRGVVDTRDAERLRAIVEDWRTPESIDQFSVGAPFFTEELLLRDGAPVDEIKVWAYYGEIGLAVLQHTEDYRVRTLQTRYVDEDGTDLGPISTEYVHRPDLPTPPLLAEVVEHSRRLSLAIRRPFVRLDFLDGGDRVLLDEITPLPIYHPLVPEIDRALGERWERARGRIRADLSAGMDPAPEWGPGDRRLSFEEEPGTMAG